MLLLENAVEKRSKDAKLGPGEEEPMIVEFVWSLLVAKVVGNHFWGAEGIDLGLCAIRFRSTSCPRSRSPS